MTVRRLTPDDAPLWREVRLRMLSAEPENYGASYADMADRPAGDWADALRRIPYVASFAGETVVGAMGLMPQPAPMGRHRGTLIAVWLEPEWRGSGRAAAMLDEIVAIARERAILQIELNVRAGNARARRFYERHEFRQHGRLPRAMLHAGVATDDVLMVRMLDA